MIKAAVQRFLASFGYRIVKIERQIRPDTKQGYNILDDVIKRLMSAGEVSVLQIGANDGQSEDYLRTLIADETAANIHATLIEPEPGSYQKLTELYEGRGNVEIWNLAISEASGTMPFFHVEDQQGNMLESATASLDRVSAEQALERLNRRDGVAHRIAQQDVETLTVADFLRKSGRSSFDVILIDTEGYDEVILRALLEHRLLPKVLSFEFIFFDPNDLHWLLKELESLGYEIARTGQDIVAIRQDGF